MPRHPAKLPIACRLEVLPGKTVCERINAAREFGFDGIALPGRFKETWLEPLRACRADCPLPMVAISLGFEHSLLSPQEGDRQRCRDSLLEMFDLCAELGAHLFNMPPCLIQDNPERIREAGTFASLRQRLDALLLDQLWLLGDEAKQRGVELLLEPVNRYESDYLNSIEHTADLCHRLNHPAVGFTADFFHMQLEELHIGAAIERAGSDGFRLRHVHVAENTRVEPGPGSLDLTPGFQALRKLEYHGWVEVECRHLSGPAQEVLPRSVAYLRQIWNEA